MRDPAARSRSVELVARTVGAQVLLLAALPANAVVTAAALLVSRRRARPAEQAAPRTVLISGGKMTKALQLARSFHAAGHRVVLVESGKYRRTGHRFSRAVAAFHVVPRPQDDGYAEALLDIVLQERVDVYVPVCSPVASYYDAVAAEVLAPHCEVLHCDAATIARLDDKYEFARAAQELGLSAPDTHRITDAAQVLAFDFASRPGVEYILKSIAYDPVHRLDLRRLPGRQDEDPEHWVRSKPISETNPWILQEFVPGREYCTHSTVRGGVVQVYCCCESSAFQLNYEMIDKPEIEKWVTTFADGLGITGQVSFDFIEADDGRLLAIECNPRTHSAITMFYNHPDLARAYLDDGVPAIRPLASSRPTYWLYQEMWRLLRHPRTVRERIRTVRRGKEAIFDADDPLPFLLVHHLQIPSLLLGNLRRLKDWMKIDFNIGKLVEPAGD